MQLSPGAFLQLTKQSVIAGAENESRMVWKAKFVTGLRQVGQSTEKNMGPAVIKCHKLGQVIMLVKKITFLATQNYELEAQPNCQEFNLIYHPLCARGASSTISKI